MSTETKQAQIPDELRYYFLTEAEKLIDSSIGYDENGEVSDDFDGVFNEELLQAKELIKQMLFKLAERIKKSA